MLELTELLTLRAKLARAEKEARKAAAAVPPAPRPPLPRTLALKPLHPQREAELDGVSTDDFSLSRAHARLRDFVYDAQYRICPHAVGHARAEGFLEPDIIGVLLSGRVRAVYTEERRWLVCGYFESGGIRLPLHVVVQVYADGLDVVTAFVPKHPHHVISRARLAVMLRYDDQKLQHRTALPGPKAGSRGRGKWKKGA
ncbi:DUF4258 domain-containing protein [Deinococcus sp.]|uniref:DUF4258 domain-containing protein n=1 Tax=Deinococcus sp. TaxID=47478 RepID=UPI003CC6B7B4